ncbi:hypothetical protein [Secundilactobacillus mixtipabuli]|uniref:Uncharacterized protein n=1 Tax=Secundilactobacillus mixtipabuli TaxID=1435342 RepID=A0A1Z5I9M2_9LACO|nr:hypothetical protein [Secundilactobacillus mixtipabuli]GAW98482.1 hypothetical protein IWT30_00427 [Secundilactobacillus mixtipabuli]
MINLIFKNNQYLDRNNQFTADIEQARIIKSRKIANQVAAKYDAEVTSYSWMPDRENPWLDDMEDE